MERPSDLWNARGKFASNEHGRWLAARLANRNWRMKVDYINIGSTPADEDCLGVGHALARKETAIYCRQLEREFPAGKFSVKGFDHDFGRYHEVVAWYGEELDVATNEAAFEAECGRGEWDEEALVELAAAGIRS